MGLAGLWLQDLPRPGPDQSPECSAGSMPSSGLGAGEDLRLEGEEDGGRQGAAWKDRARLRGDLPSARFTAPRCGRSPRPRPPARELTAAGPDTLRQGRWDLLAAGPPEAWTPRLPVRGWACPHRKDAPGLTDPHLARALRGSSGDLLKGCEGAGHTHRMRPLEQLFSLS